MNPVIDFRVKKLLLILCQETDFITVHQIAKALDISSKTVLRDLPDAEAWFKKHEVKLEKKTGVGIRVVVDSEQRTMLLEQLKQLSGAGYTPYQRRIMILYKLLNQQEPVKLLNLALTLDVTESTIASDLEKAEQWLASYSLNLVRKQGLGVYIQGSEQNLRKAMAALVHESIAEDALMELVRSSTGDVEDLVLKMIDRNTIQKLEEIVYLTQKEMHISFADSTVVALVVHLSLVLKRLSINEQIELELGLMKRLLVSEEYEMAKRLADRIFDVFGVQLPDEELCYIILHLRGAKSMDTTVNNTTRPVGNFELVRMVKEIIRLAEYETQVVLATDERLFIGLVNHLGPALNRLRAQMKIRNPLLNNIKEHYPHLMIISKRCVKHMEEQLGIELPEEEISFVAMHLGAALEYRRPLKYKYRVLLACSFGIGTSTILKTRLAKEFEQIEVVDSISTFRIDESLIVNEDIDFIVSTVRLDVKSVQVVVVNPLLFVDDKQRIVETINRLEHHEPIIRKRSKDQHFKDQLNSVQLTSQGVMELMNGFFLERIDEVSTIESLIKRFVQQYNLDLEASNKLAGELLNREIQGGIFITGHNTILLHARTGVIDDLVFGAYQLSNPLVYKNGRYAEETVDLAIFMLAPKSCAKERISVISHISKMLIERPQFLEALKSSTKDDCSQELSFILKSYLRSVMD